MTLIRIAIVFFALIGLNAAYALESSPYTPQALSDAQQAGKPVALHFHASWCPTCRAQAKVFDDLKRDSALPVTVLVVDYDKARDLKQQLGVRAQSTLIVYRGKKETARIAGETDPGKLRAALQSAL